MTETIRRMHVGLHVLVVLLLGLGAARALLAGGDARAVGPLALAWLAWYAAGHRLAVPPGVRDHATARQDATWGSRLWLAGLVAGWTALVALVSVEFSWLAYPLVLILCATLSPVVAHPASILITVVVVALQLRHDGGPGAVIGPVVGTLVAIGTAATYQRVARESEERRRLVVELVAAQDELLAMQDELAATQRESGVLAERARLARDIHDTLAQGFSSIVLLSRAGLADPAQAARHLGQIEVTASDNLAEARRVVHALTPSSLEAAPLPAAVGRLLEALAAQTGIRTSLEVDGDVQAVPTTCEVALLRVAQSALANVRLHSGAARVGITLTYGDHSVTLDVVDDGRGFDPAAAVPAGTRTGFGLRAMRERLAALGGTLEVESAPGEGTAVVAVVPLGGELR